MEVSGGRAYKVGDKVIKLTTDPNEYRNALSLRTKAITKYLINYYDARRIIGQHSYFIILMDYVEPLRDNKTGIHTKRVYLFEDVCSMYDRINDIKEDEDEGSNPSDAEFEKYMKNKDFSGCAGRNNTTVEEVISRMNQIHEIYKEGRKFNVPISDVHPGNIGLKDDHYVYFDIGCSYNGKTPRHLKGIDFEVIKN